MKLLSDMVEPVAVEKAVSVVVGQCCTPMASAKNRVSVVISSLV